MGPTWILLRSWFSFFINIPSRFQLSFILPIFIFTFDLLQIPAPPKAVLWYQNSRQLLRDADKRISISLETGQRTQSRLVVSDAGDGDSGNYTCQAENVKPATIVVFVSG
jgi:hypothetical protein